MFLCYLCHCKLLFRELNNCQVILGAIKRFCVVVLYFRSQIWLDINLCYVVTKHALTTYILCKPNSDQGYFFVIPIFYEKKLNSFLLCVRISLQKIRKRMSLGRKMIVKKDNFRG